MPNELVQVLLKFKERVTESVKSISTEHSYIHEGLLFSISLKNTLGAGVTRKITFLTPSVKYIHYRPAIIVTSADKLTMNFYESSSGNTGGTPLTAYNRNRLSPITAQSIVTDGATVTTNGTKIGGSFVGGGTGVGGARSGSEVGEENELVLKQNTLYTMELVNGSTESNEVFLKMKWYEEGGA